MANAIILMVLSGVFGVLITLAGIDIFEALLYFIIIAIMSVSWVSYANKLKPLVFGICTFLSIMVSIAIFNNSDPLIIAATSIVFQIIAYVGWIKKCLTF